MAYVHCHNCGWDNGDFEETKIALRLLKWDLKEVIKPNYAAHVKYQHLTAFKNVLTDIKDLIKSLFQSYKTFEEFETKNPEQICPKCGSKWLDVD